MNSRENEIRKILNGYFRFNDEYRIEAGKDFRDIQNLQNTALTSGLVGLKNRKYQYRSELSGEELGELCPGILLKYGVPVDLHTAPDVYALRVDVGFVNTYMITVEIDGQELLLCIYTAKSLFSGLRVRALRKKWLRRFEALKLTEVPVTMKPQLVRPEDQETEPRRRKNGDEE